MMNRVSGWRSMSDASASTLPLHSMLTGRSWRTAARKIRFEAGVARIAPRLLRHHDPDANRARCLLPVGDDTGHLRSIRIDRLDEGEAAGMSPLHLHRIA